MKKVNNKYLQEAIRIGDQLLSLGKEDTHGISWETIRRTNDYVDSWHTSYSIYWGVTGIVYFLISLYEATTDTKYLAAAQKGMKWVEWDSNIHETDNYSLPHGKMGIAFTFLKLYTTTKDDTSLKKCLHYAKACQKSLIQSLDLNEYGDGISSTLLGFVHIYTVSQEKFLLENINAFTDKLIQNARFAKKGIYWDSNPRGIRPLCGVSHGASGIGFVFLELGHYFKNPAFYYLAKQSFLYEHSFYDKKEKNWPDFRLGIVETGWENIKNAYLDGNTKAFTEHRFLCSWCHGAGGIGLTRVRAFELLQMKSYYKDIIHAKECIERRSHDAYTLCHGNGGNADIYLEEYLLSHDKKNLVKAQRIADQALAQKKELGIYISGIKGDLTKNREDLSLFNGIAGIGYFMLRMSDPKAFPSILLPKIVSQTNGKQNNDTYTALGINEIEIQNTLLRKDFPNTYNFLQRNTPSQFQDIIKTLTQPTRINAYCKYLPASKRKEIKHIYKIEQIKNTINKEKISNALLQVKEKINQERATILLELSEKDFLKTTLHLDQEIKITHIDKFSYIFKPEVYETYSTQISQFCELILVCFKKEKRVEQILQELYSMYGISQPEDKKKIYSETITQIKESIRFSILVQ